MDIKRTAVNYPIGKATHYSPQVKLNGTWFFIVLVNGERAEARLGGGHSHFSSQDSLALIDKFKEQGVFTIPSNAKLKSNQKQIIVE